MSAISDLLELIRTAIYGKQVRGAIHDAIEQCYDDVTAGVTLANAAADAATAAANRAENISDHMEPILDDFQDLEDEVYRLKTFYPKYIRNGSFGNTGNVNLATFGPYVIEDGVSSINFYTNRPIDEEGAYYSIGYEFFSVIKPDLAYDYSGRISRADCSLDGTYKVGDEIMVPSGTKSAIIMIGQAKSDGSAWIPLRNNSFDSYKLLMRKTPKVTTVNDSLTVSGAAADAKVVGDAVRTLTTLVNVGYGDIASHVYLEESDASSGTLFFKLDRVSFHTGSASPDSYYDKTWDRIKSDLNETGVTSPGGVADCLECPDKTALVFDRPAAKMKFVLRNAIQKGQIPLFFNAYGRADNLHPTLLGAKIFSVKKLIQTTEQSMRMVENRVDSLENLQKSEVELSLTLGKAWGGQVGQVASLGNNANRVSNVVPISLGSNTYTVSVSSGYRISFRTLNSEGVILADSGWITTSTTLTTNPNYKYAFTGGKLSDAAVTLAEFESNYNIENGSPLIDAVTSLANQVPNKVSKQDVLATIVFPGTVWAEIDTANDTLTLPADTSILANDASNTRYNFASAQTISLKIPNRNSMKLYFNPANSTFNLVAWSDRIPNNCLLICYYNDFGITNPFIAISCRYKIDGRPFGIESGEQTAQIVNTSNVKAVNHRGYNSVAPENTLPAFKLSKENGFRYVETDVRFTSDGVPVLLHDTTINRTARNSDGTSISSTISIDAITYEQALTYDFGVWKSSQYAGTKIPSLDGFMALCRKIGLTPRVELNVLTVENAQTMFDVIDKYGMARKVEYNCNNLSVAQKFLELEPSATIVYGMSSYDADTVTSIGALKTANNTIIINMYYTAVTPALISQCKQYDIELEVWTVNDNSTILGLDPYVSGVTSDSINASVLLYNSGMA